MLRHPLRLTGGQLLPEEVLTEGLPPFAPFSEPWTPRHGLAAKAESQPRGCVIRAGRGPESLSPFIGAWCLPG